ncbi:hypothetical protein ACS0TY_030616 [Phlomoides rotata]
MKCINACSTSTHVEDNIMFYVVSTESDEIEHCVKYDSSKIIVALARIGICYKTKNGVPWRHEVARKYYNILLIGQESDESREIIENSYNRYFVTINTMINPEHFVTKGRSKWIKGHFQRNKKKSGDTSSELPPPQRVWFQYSNY